MDTINPLQAWIDRQTVALPSGKSRPMTANNFCETHGFPLAVIYSLLRYGKSDMSASVIHKIEQATGGEVTAQQLVDYLALVRKSNEPAIA